MTVKIELREDLDPDVNFYYNYQFKIYREPYLIWDKNTWKSILATCKVYQIRVDGGYAGDVVLERRRRKGANYIVDFSILPEYQRRGVGRTVLKTIRTREGKLTAVTRRETLPFFVRSGFILRKTITNYYDLGVDGYYVVSPASPASVGPMLPG